MGGPTVTECRAEIPIPELAVAVPCWHLPPCPVHDWTEPDRDRDPV